jgi:hypothetical protein
MASPENCDRAGGAIRLRAYLRIQLGTSARDPGPAESAPCAPRDIVVLVAAIEQNCRSRRLQGPNRGRIGCNDTLDLAEAR